MEYVITTNELCKRYKKFQVLDGINMHVPKGAIYGFIGKNGAGKTTLIRVICGLQEPTEGNYSIYGIQNSEKEIAQSRRRMGAVVEAPAIFNNMTAEENLKQQYCILGSPSFEGVYELLKLVGLENTGKKKAKDFSLGMRQRLGIAVALCGNPDFLVLDEPVNGLDPQGIVEIRELILKLNQEYQITFLISSHILDELAKVATYYGFINKGKIIKEVSAAELEKTYGKCIGIQVTNTETLSQVLEERKIDYKILSKQEADIYGKINITDLTLALASQNCEVLSINSHDETLESYYMNLIGGGENA